MGGSDAYPSCTNVNFAFDTALAAARDCWSLASQFRSHDASLSTSAGQLLAWVGPKRTQFDQMIGDIHTEAEAVASALESLAREFASAWASARGEQDRINRGRRIQQDLATSTGTAGDLLGVFTGSGEYGPPPDDPDVPVPPSFEATRAPLYPDYQLQ